jgi:transposase
MKRTHVLQEIRIMRFEEIYQWQLERNLTNEEAAEILGVCERTYRRWCRRYEDEDTKEIGVSPEIRNNNLFHITGLGPLLL